MTIESLRQKLDEMKNKAGLIGGSVVIHEYDEVKHDVSAHINPEGWDIEVTLKKGFNPIKDKRQKAYARKKKIANGLETLVAHVGGLHEPAHWELPYGSELGCPYDPYNHDKILEAVKNALPKDKQAHASYVANIFEDTLINPRCKEQNGDFSGQVLFWDNEGVSFRAQGQKHFTPVYEAFVKLNMHLFGDNVDRALLERHYSNDKRVDGAVEKVVKDLHLPANIVATPQGTRPLFVRGNWPAMARTFARHLAPLLDVAPKERTSAYDGSQGEGGEGSEEQPAGNGVEERVRSPEGKEEIAYGRLAGDERLSTNLTTYEQLDALYRRLAKDIPVKVEALSREQHLAIAPLTFRAFDPEKDDPSKIKASKMKLTDQGLTFGYQQQPLVIEARSKVQRKSFPDFKMVVLDSSGSMAKGISGDAGSKNTIPWGNNSKYHFALLGFYGIENFLQRQGIAPYIKHGVSVFSDRTRFAEADFDRIEEVRKLALSPEFGGTHLDAKVLTGALRGRDSFVLSISDGEIKNWDSEKGEFHKLAGNNYFAHIQIGGSNSFTQDLKRWDMPVFYVRSGKDLANLMVDVTQTQYRRFVRE